MKLFCCSLTSFRHNPAAAVEFLLRLRHQRGELIDPRHVDLSTDRVLEQALLDSHICLVRWGLGVLLPQLLKLATHPYKVVTDQAALLAPCAAQQNFEQAVARSV